MSKTETAMSLSQHRSESVKPLIKSQSEQQRQVSKITEQIEAEARSHSENLAETVSRLSDDLSAINLAAQSSIKGLEDQTDKSAQSLKTAATQLVKSAKAANSSAQNLELTLERQLSKARWTTLLIVSLSSAIAGSMLLIIFLITQPNWIRSLWSVSQALGISPN